MENKSKNYIHYWRGYNNILLVECLSSWCDRIRDMVVDMVQFHVQNMFYNLFFIIERNNSKWCKDIPTFCFFQWDIIYTRKRERNLFRYIVITLFFWSYIATILDYIFNFYLTMDWFFFENRFIWKLQETSNSPIFFHLEWNDNRFPYH